MKARLSVLLLCASAICPLAASAQGILMESYSDNELLQLMQNEGYGASEIVSEHHIRIKINGDSFYLINMEDGDLQAYYGVTGLNVTYQDMNEWNQTKRLSKAYLDDDMDPSLEADLLANGGLTAKQVAEFFKVFQSSVKQFRTFLMEHDAS